MNNMMFSFYRNVVGFSILVMFLFTIGLGDLVFDFDFRMLQLGGSDVCIIIDDFLESDSEVVFLSQKFFIVFFVDRVGERF